MKASVEATDSRDGRSSSDDELIKVTLGVRALWLGEHHVHDVQSRQEGLAQAEIWGRYCRRHLGQYGV